MTERDPLADLTDAPLSPIGTNLKRSLTLFFSFRKDLIEQRRTAELIGLLTHIAPALEPTNYGYCEPLKQSWSGNSPHELADWSTDFSWRGQSRKVEGTLSSSNWRAACSMCLWIADGSDLWMDAERIIEAVAGFGELAYAMAHTPSPDEIPHHRRLRILFPVNRKRGPLSYVMTSADFDEELPALFGVNYFDRQWFAKHEASIRKFKALGSYQMTEMADGVLICNRADWRSHDNNVPASGIEHH